MIKGSKIVFDNFFGFSNENQKNIYNELYNSLNEEEKLEKRAIESIFKPYIDQVDDLYNLCDLSQKLRSFYIERLYKNNKESLDNFFSGKKYTTLKDYEYMFLANANTYDDKVINFMTKVFDVNYIDKEMQLTKNFVDNYRNASYKNKLEFIKNLVNEYKLVTYLPRDYIPGVNLIEKEFDGLVMFLFGYDTLEKYNELEPVRKINFLYRYKEDIENMYELQLEESSKDNKAKRLNKRNHPMLIKGN